MHIDAYLMRKACKFQNDQISSTYVIQAKVFRSFLPQNPQLPQSLNLQFVQSPLDVQLQLNIPFDKGKTQNVIVTLTSSSSTPSTHTC